MSTITLSSLPQKFVGTMNNKKIKVQSSVAPTRKA